MEKKLVIGYKDWQDCVEKWVEIALHPIRERGIVEEACGLCNAKDRSGVSCDACPAYLEICNPFTDDDTIFSKIANTDNLTNWRFVREGALEILQWLQELGELAGWTT